jgi:hypothetical protein
MSQFSTLVIFFEGPKIKHPKQVTKAALELDKSWKTIYLVAKKAMQAVWDFIENREDDVQKAILSHLHELLMGHPNMVTKIRYQIPFYYQKSWVCYLNPLKNSGVEVVFLRANELSNEQGALQFNGRKQVAGLSYFSPKDIDETLLLEILGEAILLDETVPYASKRIKG